MKKQFTLKLNRDREWAICNDEGVPAHDGFCQCGLRRIFDIPRGATELVLTLSTRKAKGMLCVSWGKGDDAIEFPGLNIHYSPYLLRKVRRDVAKAMGIELGSCYVKARPANTVLLYAKIQMPATTFKTIPMREDV